MAEESYVEIKKTQDEIAKLLADFQDSHKKLQSEGKSNSEALTKMGSAFAESTEKLQAMSLKMEAEEKARKDLELALSRMNESGNKGKSLTDPDYERGFQRFAHYGEKSVSAETMEKEVKSYISSLGMTLSPDEYVQVKTLLVGSNPDGGYLVPTERQSTIKKRQFETTLMRSLATTVNIGTTDTDFILDDGEFASEKVGELDTRNNTASSQIGVITIPTHEQAARVPVTHKIIDDATWNIDNLVTGKAGEKFARQENHEFMTGAAAHEAQGILSLADWAALGVYERQALETRPAVGYTQGGVTYPVGPDDFIELQSDLLEDYQSNANWLFSRKGWAYVMQLKDADGQYLLNPQMLFAGVTPTLLGHPVKMSPDIAHPNTGGIVACYGDFREGYAIVDRLGMRLIRDIYSVDGFVLFKFSKRTGGAVVNYQAIKRLRVPLNT
jgi:HK97 family phage major capsid protein